jgi:hypothetical protein
LWLGAGGFGCPDCKSQHVPVQFDAIGLQIPNGANTFISISAVTIASCADTMLAPENETVAKVEFRP